MGEYKNSNVDWIGKVPVNWDIQPLGIYFDERREKVSDTEFEPLSVTKSGVVKQLENIAKSDAHDDRKKVCKNDFVINSRSDRKQSCGLSNFNGSVSLINIVLTPNIDKILPNYVKYLFDNCMFAEEFYRNGHGIVADLWTTNFSEMKKISIPIPPIEEQNKIAKLLEIKISKIDIILSNLYLQIDNLNKQRNAIINNKIIDTYKENIDDNNDKYFKKIPKEYIKRFKDFFITNTGLNITKEDLIDNGLNVISYGQIHSKDNKTTYLTKELLRFVDFKYSTNLKSKVKIGDIIFADTSEDLEGAGNCIMNDSNSTLYAGYHTIIASPKDKRYSKYLAYLFMTDNWRKQLREVVNGVKVFSITQQILKNTKIILPPVNTIDNITNYLDKKCKIIDEIIENKQKQIEKMENYKKSIIYEYVTGKKRVKEVV